jgi:hypothetical protein
MDIRINEDWRLHSGTYSFTLKARKVAAKDSKSFKAGDEYWVDMAFYSTLEQALRGFVDYSIRTSSVTSFEELHEYMDALKAQIEGVREALEI